MYLFLILLSILNLPGSIYDIPLKTIDGKSADLSPYKGKKILIVNTASECGQTPQFEQLEKVYEKYRDKLVIIGIPTNDFGGQDPGSNEEISTFCRKNYGVTFPMMSKAKALGDEKDMIFQWLISQPNPDFSGEIKWNFEKFLIDENGRLIHRFHHKVKPDDPLIIEAIEL
jgi:glutathione peroxidase